MPNNPKPRIVLTLQVPLTRVRAAWLVEMARSRGRSLDALAADLLHNASLDYQMDRAPESDPDENPDEVASQRGGDAHQGAGRRA